ncbi:MAG: aldehyde dehydrogenase family protein, partial [Hyphomicrobiales bacterium]|nr:aldehyde dehydrogenase family protein [Hyphomicrobiales bacterium]
MHITGEHIIGAARAWGSGAPFRAVNPATGEALGPEVREPGPAEIEQACALADAAFDHFRETGLEARAGFLEAIAAGIDDLGEVLIERAIAETGLPRARLGGERARTVGQLRMFADVVRRGDFAGARIDPALPER